MTRTICCLILLLLVLIPSAHLSAAGAPPLTRIVPVALWSEETAGIPAPQDYPNRLPDGLIFRGEHLYIKVRFIGYPAWTTLAYRSGTEMGRVLAYTELARTPLTDGTRMIVGYEQTVMIAFAELGAAETDLCITTDDAGGGGQRYAYVRGIQTGARQQ